MKFFKKVLSITLLFTLHFLIARTRGDTAQAARTIIPVNKSTIEQPTSYAQALRIIKTKMQPDEVIHNNLLTQEFINFIQSLNFSAIETKALLEAGAHIHATWTNNNAINKQTLLFLNSTIQSIIPTISPAVSQKVITKSQSYAQALEVIKTKMQPGEVVRNNALTQEFINFVRTFGLSTIETKALLEAGANIHATWTNNNEINIQTLLSLNNTIQSMASRISLFIPKRPRTKPQSTTQAAALCQHAKLRCLKNIGEV